MQNEVSEILAENGYDVERIPRSWAKKRGIKGDYFIEGVRFEHTAPRGKSGIDGLLKTLVSKVDTQEVHHFVVDLRRSKLNAVSDVAEFFARKENQYGGLIKEIKVVDQSGLIVTVLG